LGFDIDTLHFWILKWYLFNFFTNIWHYALSLRNISKIRKKKCNLGIAMSQSVVLDRPRLVNLKLSEGCSSVNLGCRIFEAAWLIVVLFAGPLKQADCLPTASASWRWSHLHLCCRVNQTTVGWCCLQWATYERPSESLVLKWRIKPLHIYNMLLNEHYYTWIRNG